MEFIFLQQIFYLLGVNIYYGYGYSVMSCSSNINWCDISWHHILLLQSNRHPCDMNMHSRINQVNRQYLQFTWTAVVSDLFKSQGRYRMLAHPGMSRSSTRRCRCDQLIVCRRKSPTPERPERYKRPRSCDHFPRQCQTTNRRQSSPASVAGFRRAGLKGWSHSSNTI